MEYECCDPKALSGNWYQIKEEVMKANIYRSLEEDANIYTTKHRVDRRRDFIQEYIAMGMFRYAEALFAGHIIKTNEIRSKPSMLRDAYIINTESLFRIKREE